MSEILLPQCGQDRGQRIDTRWQIDWHTVPDGPANALAHGPPNSVTKGVHNTSTRSEIPALLRCPNNFLLSGSGVATATITATATSHKG